MHEIRFPSWPHLAQPLVTTVPQSETKRKQYGEKIKMARLPTIAKLNAVETKNQDSYNFSTCLWSWWSSSEKKTQCLSLFHRHIFRHCDFVWIVWHPCDLRFQSIGMWRYISFIKNILWLWVRIWNSADRECPNVSMVQFNTEPKRLHFLTLFFLHWLKVSHRVVKVKWLLNVCRNGQNHWPKMDFIERFFAAFLLLWMTNFYAIEYEVSFIDCLHFVMANRGGTVLMCLCTYVFFVKLFFAIVLSLDMI